MRTAARVFLASSAVGLLLATCQVAVAGQIPAPGNHALRPDETPKPKAVWCWWYSPKVVVCGPRGSAPPGWREYLLPIAPDGLPVMTREMMRDRPLDI